MNVRNIAFSKNRILKWTPAFLTLLAIFLFSARPSTDVEYSLLRHIAYKGGHVLGYSILSFSFWRAFEFNPKRLWLAWALAVLYAASDEFHQSFVPGRHPAAFDVLVYDNAGALLSLWFGSVFLKQKPPAPEEPVVSDQPLTSNR